MHPNPVFREADKARLERLVTDIGFGMVFLTTPKGPRVAHVPVLSDGNGDIRFHLARSNTMTPHLDDARDRVVQYAPHGPRTAFTPNCTVSLGWFGVGRKRPPPPGTAPGPG